MRLFVGIELCEALRDAAASVAGALRTALGPSVDVRWVAPEKLHVTVRFIGSVADARVPAVVDALARPIAVAPFDVQLGPCGAFPRSGPPRVIWIGLAAGEPSVREIHDELDRRLEPLGFAREARPFSAHLTLARVKELRQASSADVRRTIAAHDPGGGRCRATDATVFHSRLSPAGSRYESLARIPLVA